MNLPEFGVKKPVTNLMIFCAILILAFYALWILGIDNMPKIEPPIISVISIYPGANPEDVEIKVTEPLENQLSTTPGLEKITSRSLEGFSLVTLKFAWGTDLDVATNDIRDRIDLAKRSLPDIPDEMDQPFIFKFNTAMMPVFVIGVTAQQTYPELYNLIDKKVGDVIRQVPGVGTINLSGGLERQINVWIDRHRLEGYGFSVLDIENALRQENVSQPAGSLKSGLTEYLIRLPGEFAYPEEINSVILGTRDSSFVYLKDVARVEDSFKEVTSEARINQHQGLIMQIQKQTDTNTVEVAKRVQAKLAELRKTLPADVDMITLFDTSADIITSINSLKEAVWTGIGFVILVIWFFLRQLLPSMIIAFSIPFSLLIAFIYLFLSGKTVNTVSLSSLAIAAGMVVDDAIVVVDNISRHLERGHRPREAAIFGTSEMLLAVSASTLTTVVVFLPMLFITGFVGIMFGELAIIVTVTLLGSLFTAMTFTPMLCSRWLKPPEAAQKKNIFVARFYAISERLFVFLEELYGRMLAWGLGHKKLIVFGFLGVFFVSLGLTRFIGNEFIPEEDTGDVRFVLQLPIGTRLEETDKVGRQIEEILKKEISEKRFYYVRIGQLSGMGRVMGQASGSHVIAGGLKLVPKQERRRSDKDVAQALREKIRSIPGSIKLDFTTGSPIGQFITGGSSKAVTVDIIGHSFEETNAVAAQVKAIMEKVPGAVDAAISRDLNLPEIKIEVDREKARSVGLNMKTVADTIKTYIAGDTATKYREKGETYDIFVRLEESSRSSLEDVKSLVIVSPFTGKQIKLSNIAKVYEILGPLEVERQNRERVVHVECNTFKRSMGEVIKDIKAEIQKLIIPADIMINFGGQAEEQKKAFADMLLLLVLSIFLVYMVMASQFESLFDPFIIMFSIPFTFVGVILGMLAFRVTLSIISFLGVVMLMGMVVKNAIVLISYINILRQRGHPMAEAITLGGKNRLRPVLMTTLTTLFGLLPLALSRGEGSEIWQPLGITMIGGLSVSTLITLIFIPTIYALFHRKEALRGGA